MDPFGAALALVLAGLVGLGAVWAAVHTDSEARTAADVRFQVDLQRQVDRQDQEILELRRMLESQAAELQEQDREIQSLGEAVDDPS